MTVYALDAAERKDLLERFLRYVRVDTQSDDAATCFPSTEKQKDLGRILVEELKADRTAAKAAIQDKSHAGTCNL